MHFIFSVFCLYYPLASEAGYFATSPAHGGEEVVLKASSTWNQSWCLLLCIPMRGNECVIS